MKNDTTIYEVSCYFKGLIYESDFNTEYRTRNIASQIVSDWIFDKQCKANERNRNIRSQKGLLTYEI